MNAETNTEAETTETVTEAPMLSSSRAPRLQSAINQETGTVTIANPSGAVLMTARIADIPDFGRKWLELRGLARELMMSRDPDATLAALQRGETLGRTPAKAKGPDEWEQAVAAALVEQTKKYDVPVGAVEAAERAAAMTKEQRREARRDPLVVKHHAKITGRAGGIAAILNPA